VTAALALRGRGLLVCLAWSQVITPAQAPLSSPPVLLVPVLLVPVPLRPVLAVLLAEPLGLARRGRGSRRAGRRM
jgi:hypothetical protein